jgi:cysteinyl-tRNA synthetase
MDHDLDTPAAVAGGFELLRAARAADASAATALAAAVFEMFEVALGLPLRAEVEAVPAAAAALAAERDEARRRKDWARADAIRDQLAADGWMVEDGPEGTTLRRLTSGRFGSGRFSSGR